MTTLTRGQCAPLLLRSSPVLRSTLPYSAGQRHVFLRHDLRRGRADYFANPPRIKHIDTKDPTYLKLVRSYGGWDDANKMLSPIQYEKLLADGEDGFGTAEWVCDCIALAFENGYLAAENFPNTIFGCRADFESFCESLNDYELFWVNDRHFAAFFNLLGNTEEQCITYATIAEALIDNFGEE